MQSFKKEEYVCVNLLVQIIFLHWRDPLSEFQCTQRTEVGVNLNFQAHPYGVAFLNPWNIPNKISESLNLKMKFEIHTIINK